MQELKVAIIGFGLSGNVFHNGLMSAHKGYKVKMVMTSQKDKLSQFLPEAIPVSDIKQIIHDPEISLVVNAAPVQVHYEYTKKCLLAGKHVVVEKPFVTDVNEGEELIKIAKEKNLYLTVFQNRRFDSDFLTVKKLIEEKRLGDLKQFESHFSRFRPEHQDRWKEKVALGNGTLYELGTHLIDQALVLFGRPEYVIVDTENQKDVEAAPDYFHIIMNYKKLRVILHGSSYTKITPRFLLHGTLGSFVKYGQDNQESLMRDGIMPGSENFGVEAAKNYGSLYTYPDENELCEKIVSEKGNYEAFYHQVYDAITSGDYTPVVDPQDALEVIKIVQKGIL